MADYYPLIAKAVAGLTDATPEQRTLVYARARDALIKHLRNSAETPSEIEIAQQGLALDEAIKRVEAEIVNGALSPNAHPADGREGATTLAAEPAAPEVVPAQPDVLEAVASAPVPVPSLPHTPVASAPSASNAPKASAPKARGVSADPDKTRARRKLFTLTVAGLGAVAILGIAVIAFVTRDSPSRFSTRPEPSRTEAPDSGKIGERVGEVTPPRSGDGNTPSQPRVLSEPPAIAVSQRAILYEETGEAQRPKQVNGRVVWRTEQLPARPGQAEETAIRTQIEFAENGMSIDIVMRRNRDAALPASHTMEFRFTFKGGGGPVSEVGLPQLKPEESVRGVPLLGVPVQISENFFLVGLSSLPADIVRNTDLLLNRSWFDIALRLPDNRRAVLAFEKGIGGTDTLQRAFAAWE